MAELHGIVLGLADCPSSWTWNSEQPKAWHHYVIMGADCKHIPLVHSGLKSPERKNGPSNRFTVRIREPMSSWKILSL